MASPPYEYEDLLSKSIRILEDKNNRTDPTGKLNELRLPPKRRQQAAALPKFDNAEQHSNSPYVTVTLEAPSILSLSAAYPIKVTLRHHHNAAGNPNDRPATFSLNDTVLTTIDDTDIFPWLVLHHVEDKMIEIDDGNHGPERPSDVDASEGNGGQTAVSAESGFVSLAVGESISLNTDLLVTGEGIQFEIGEKYSLGFRGCYLYWWKWGTLEELRDVKKGDGEQDETVPRMTIPASNLVDFTVQK